MCSVQRWPFSNTCIIITAPLAQNQGDKNSDHLSLSYIGIYRLMSYTVGKLRVSLFNGQGSTSTAAMAS